MDSRANLCFFLALCALICLVTLNINLEILHLFYNSAFVGGLLSGSLHALTGSDHIAALLPIIFGKRWWYSSFTGMIWGLGHGLTSAFIGYISYKMKSYLLESTELFEIYGYLVDLAVGLTLIVIGTMGYYESVDHKNEVSSTSPEIVTCTSQELLVTDIEQQRSDDQFFLSTANDASNTTNKGNSDILINIWGGLSRHLSTLLVRFTSCSAVFINGCVMGISWDGLPSLAPTVVLEDWPLVLFLVAYLVSTFVTMGFTAALVGEATCWLSRVTKINIAERLAIMSSLAAILIGFCWLISAVINYIHITDNTSFNNNDNWGVHLFNNNNDNHNNNDNNSNDNFQYTTYGTSMGVLLGTCSVLSVLGVVLGAIYYEFRSTPLFQQEGADNSKMSFLQLIGKKTKPLLYKV